jgi:archaellum component FlaC
MKKDRNCGMNMPYPAYMPNMMPGIPAMNMYANDMGFVNNSSSYQNGYDQQFSNLSNRINSLERRINSLESLVGNNSNTYNTSNYQML